MKTTTLLIAFTALASLASARDDSSAFERIKSLAGTWKGTAASHGSAGGPMTVTYRVVSNGSAVEETIDPGGSHEMLTLYYLDGKSLVLTHYCAMANQPHMKLASGTADELKFDFAGGTNIKPGDAHMHSLDFKFLAPDHIQANWLALMGGKPMMHAEFDLRRVTTNH